MEKDARAQQVQQLAFQLDVLEDIAAAGGGPFVAGEDISYGDGALAPSFVFFTEILPKHFGEPVSSIYCGPSTVACTAVASQVTSHLPLAA